MKRTVKLVMIMVVLVSVLMSLSLPVFAADVNLTSINTTYTGNTQQMASIAGNVMGLIRNIALIAGAIALMVIGVKYIMGSVEEKAEYKKSLVPLVVGIVIVMSATTIVSFIFDFAK